MHLMYPSLAVIEQPSAVAGCNTPSYYPVMSVCLCVCVCRAGDPGLAWSTRISEWLRQQRLVSVLYMVRTFTR